MVCLARLDTPYNLISTLRNQHLIIAFMFGCAVFGVAPSQAQTANQPRAVDPTKAAAAGIRRLSGRHLTLYTDLPSDAEVDRLPTAFDQAVPQWAAYFHVPRSKTADWRMQAFLIGDREKFDALGLMPAGHDDFRNGFSLGSELWLYEQPTAYYRRHLLLHEGTHGFMASLLGGCGPGWYMEGTAELMATHHLDDKTGRLTLRYMPKSRREVPMLGRIKLVREAYAADRALALPAVMAIDNRVFLDNEQYAWCWALARFLDDHPRYRERFRSLRKYVRDRRFNEHFQQLYADDWPDLAVEWQPFVASLEHGHDVARSAIEFRRGEPIAAGTRNVEVASNRGWQSSGVYLEAGREYRITARGRYQLARDTDGVWWCEPGGVTIEYYAGRPLGMLLGAIDERDDENPTTAAGFLRPLTIGLESTLESERSGTLYLRVNDSPSRLAENVGGAHVAIEAL